MKNRIFLTFVIIVLIFCVFSCKDKMITISSSEDGPYIFDKGDSLLIVSFVSRDNLDSVYVHKSNIKGLSLNCEFDSIACPPVRFSIYTSQTGEEDSFPMPSKLMAISDIEGNFEDYYRLLLNNNVINEKYEWTFGDGHLVINGDLVDRGNYVTQCLWLTYKLEEEARKHGGKVHYLLGNHEQLVLAGYDNYCAEKYHIIFDNMKTGISEIFSSEALLGKWIRSKNSVIKIGNLLFVHAGISPLIPDYNLNLKEMNSVISNNLEDFDFETEDAWALLTSGGILWYRGLIEDDDNGEYKKIESAELDKVLSYYNAEAIVIGHTPVDYVSTDFDGKVIRIDVDHYTNSSGLLIEDGTMYIVDGRGNKKILQ